MSETHPALISYTGFIFLGILTAILVIGLILLIYVYLDHRGKKYTVTDRRVTAKKGILTKTVDEVNIAHIRSMNVKQDLWGRMMNYGDVFIGTAGTEGVEVTIRGVKNPVALKDLITRQGGRIDQKDKD